MLTCNQCGTGNLSDADFYVCGTAANGDRLRRKQCKKCITARVRKQSADNPRAHRETAGAMRGLEPLDSHVCGICGLRGHEGTDMAQRAEVCPVLQPRSTGMGQGGGEHEGDGRKGVGNGGSR